jgi:hypothetical protein
LGLKLVGSPNQTRRVMTINSNGEAREKVSRGGQGSAWSHRVEDFQAETRNPIDFRYRRLHCVRRAFRSPILLGLGNLAKLSQAIWLSAAF